MFDLGRLDPLSDRPEDEDLVSASRRQLGELTHAAMGQLGVESRMVLALRLFEDMPHADIAQILGCSKLGARMQFYSAKRSLNRELKRLGLTRKSYLPAIAAFGAITSRC